MIPTGTSERIPLEEKISEFHTLKAGGYAIQDGGLAPVASYDGCYCNVIGLSLWATIDVLRKGGIRVDASAVDLLPQCAACPMARPDLLRV